MTGVSSYILNNWRLLNLDLHLYRCECKLKAVMIFIPKLLESNDTQFLRMVCHIPTEVITGTTICHRHLIQKWSTGFPLPFGAPSSALFLVAKKCKKKRATGLEEAHWARSSIITAALLEARHWCRKWAEYACKVRYAEEDQQRETERERIQRQEGEGGEREAGLFRRMISGAG